MNKTWKVILAFLGVFLAGAVFGGFISVQVAHEYVSDHTHKPPMEKFVPMIMRKYSARLELTPEQLEKIRPIVKAADDELRILRRTSFSSTVAVADKMNDEIAAVLTPRQQDELKAMLREWQERWKKDRERRARDRKQSPRPPQPKPESPAGDAAPPSPPE